ncbi:MAG: diguanylate cyclase domain-containing protein [Pseudomonadota bacterium]
MRQISRAIPTQDPVYDEREATKDPQAPLEVLLIGSDTPAMLGLETILRETKTNYRTTRVEHLQQALALLLQRQFVMLLFDLSLTHSPWHDALERLADAAPLALRIGLTDNDEGPSPREARRHGAHDTLSLSRLDPYWLPRLLDTALHLNQTQHATEEALHIEKERAQVTLDSIGDAVISTDTACRVTYLNRVAQTMTGWIQEDALGRPIAEVFHIVDDKSHQPARDPAQRAIEENRIVELAMGTILIGRDNSELAIEDSAAPIHDRNGQVTGAVLVFHHVHQSLAIASRMSHLAKHDALTDLPNRVLLEERLERAIGLAKRHRQQVALLFIDLDAFKAVNDRLGHAAGDGLLQSIARRLKSCVRETDTVCRLGGDEFVILLTEVHGIDDTHHVAETIFRALRPPHRIGEHTIDMTVSLGISLYPDSGTTPDELIHRADAAMYHIKRQGRNAYQVFSGDMLT